MVREFINGLRRLGASPTPLSEIQGYHANLQRGDGLGAPSFDEALKDYRATSSRQNRYLMF